MCYCDAGYMGEDCTVIYQQDCTKSCKHGSCINQLCECDAGWKGAHCDIKAKGFLNTPMHGNYASECIHHIEADDEVVVIEGAMKIYRKLGNGTRILHHAPKCSAKIPSVPHQTWQTWASTGASSGITTASSQWSVPEVPKNVGEQTVFLFIGTTEQRGGGAIMQGVLQFGGSAAGGGQYYAMASWFYDSAANIAYSSIINASPGDTVSSSITTGTSGYTVVSTNINQDKTTKLNVANGDPQYVFFVTLEAYGLLSCSQLPPGLVVFEEIKLQSEGRPITPTWSTSTPVKQCNEGAKGAGSSVTITF